jgi:Tfp pilus assembly protein FimT
MMFVVAIVGVLFVMSIPMLMTAANSFKLSGAARGISGQLALARLRATASFTQTQLNVTNAAAGQYELDLCTTKNKSTGGCTTFTQDTNTGTQYLPSGITFGFPATFAQPGTSGQTSAYSQTYQIIFNSRGIPVSSSPTSGPTPTASDALYLTDNQGHYYAITVYASGKVTMFQWQSASSKWKEM